MSLSKPLFSFLIVVFLVACGGGGSSDDGVAPITTDPVDPPEPPAIKPNLFMMVVPPGAQGNSGTSGQGVAPPDNFTDQLFLYEELAFSPEGLTGDAVDCNPPVNVEEFAANISTDEGSRDACNYFKPAGLTAPDDATCIQRTNPRTGGVAEICFDGWGVPYVEALTREDAMFGFGYAGAATRGWLFDVLRYIGRGRLSEFLGPADDLFAFDADIAGVAGYSEEEITRILESTGGQWLFPETDSQWATDAPDPVISVDSEDHVCHASSEPVGRDAVQFPNPNDDPAYGKFGVLSKMIICDVDSMVAGMNHWISNDVNGGAISVATQADYALTTTVGLGAVGPRVPACNNPNNCDGGTGFTRNDIVASAILIQSIFAFGGGDEGNNVRAIQAIEPGVGGANLAVSTRACEYWRDLRHATDPVTPSTDPVNAVGARQSPATLSEACPQSFPAGTAIWDAGSYEGREIFRHTPIGLPLGSLSTEPTDSLASVDIGPIGVTAKTDGESDSEELPAPQSLTDLFRMPGDKRLALFKKIEERFRRVALDKAERGIEPRLDQAATIALSDSPYASAHASLQKAGFPVPRLMSNFVGVTASETEDGQPIAVMGPQTSYFLPQLLWEVALVSGGDNPGPFDFAGRGVVFGQLPYINIGRGIDFAWSATSGNSDLVDTRVSRVCLLSGGGLDAALNGAASIDDQFNNETGAAGADDFPDFDGYLFDAGDGNGLQCRPVIRRKDEFTSSGTAASAALGSTSLAENVEVFVMRTHYGPIIATATVGGAPVAISTERSTFYAELDTAPPFALATTRVIGARGAGDMQVQDFFEVFNGVTGTFNWQYVQKNNLAWYHSGLFPDRSALQHGELPVWGDGSADWLGRAVDLTTDPDFFNRDFYPNILTVTKERTITSTSAMPGLSIPVYFEFSNFRQLEDHPRVNNPPLGYLHSWNNNPAADWWAADGNGSYGPIHRANMLRDRLQVFQDTGRKHTIGTLVEIMSDAAHTDLVGMRVVPLLVEILNTTPQQQDFSGFPEIADFAQLQEMIEFMRQWAGDGSVHWMIDETEEGLGGYRRTLRDGSQPRARTDDGSDVDVEFVYAYRGPVVLMDAWYPELVDHTLAQFREIEAAGGSVLSGFENAPGPMGSAYQNGWYFTLNRSYANALDAELGGDRSEGSNYRRIACAATLSNESPGFEACRNGVLQALNDALASLNGWDQRAAWDGTEDGTSPTVENGDAIRHTAISAQTMDAMHWSNRPTYQGVFQIFTDRSDQAQQD